MSEVDGYPGHYAYPLVTWGSTILGALVALITSLMLNLLGAALGIAVTAFAPSANAAAGAGIVGIVWVAVANLIALGFGAWVAARATANPDHHGGTLQGIAVWALSSFAVLFLATSALTGLGGAAMQAANLQASVAATQGSQPSDTQRQTPALSSNLQANAPEIQADAAKAAGGAAVGAFGGFLALVLGFIAAVVGARAGARHPTWADRPRYTIVERRHGRTVVDS